MSDQVASEIHLLAGRALVRGGVESQLELAEEALQLSYLISPTRGTSRVERIVGVSYGSLWLPSWNQSKVVQQSHDDRSCGAKDSLSGPVEISYDMSSTPVNNHMWRKQIFLLSSSTKSNGCPNPRADGAVKIGLTC